jgi:[ribosomal protein S5]-alanine N-acetyltransferase
MALAASRPHPPQPILRTKRLRLRPISATDTAALHEPFSDAETMRWNELPATRSLAETAKRVDLFLVPMPFWHATWVLVEGPDAPAIGLVCYHHREAWNGRLEVGFMLPRPYRGRGLAQEATTALLDYCFGSLQINRAEITVNPENKAAIRVTERLGFRCEGRPLRRPRSVGRKYRDQLLYGLLYGEWARALAGRPAVTSIRP